MDQKLKERLVGMAVLLLLGFVFIPIILDGEPSQEDNNQEIELPVPKGEASHVLDFKTGQVKKLELPKLESSAKPANTETNSRITGTAQPTVSGKREIVPNESLKKHDSKSVQSAGIIKSDTNTATELKTVKSGLTTIKTLESPGAKVQDEIERVAADPSSAWVVQIGSFGDRNNAENEVQVLKSKGFPAFLSRYVNDNKKVLFRVRVGPEKDRSRAEKLAESLNKAGIKGQVVAHP